MKDPATTLEDIRTNLTRLTQIMQKEWNPNPEQQTNRTPKPAHAPAPINLDAQQAIQDATEDLQSILYMLGLYLWRDWRRIIKTLANHTAELQPYMPILEQIETDTRRQSQPPTAADQIAGKYICVTPTQAVDYISRTYSITINVNTLTTWLRRGKLGAHQAGEGTYLIPISTLEKTLTTHEKRKK